MKEVWLPVIGYEDLYEVSNKGRVRNSRKKILKQQPDGYKLLYLKVCLYKDGKMKNKRVHRLVAKAHLQNPKNKAEVNHEDVNPKNNRIDNLTWCTRSENEQHKLFMRGCFSVERGVPMNTITIQGY